MDHPLALIALGVFGVILTIRALIMGGTSASARTITRSDEPLAYWSTIVAAVLITVFFFWKAFHNP
jgi:hypothetical protein